MTTDGSLPLAVLTYDFERSEINLFGMREVF